MYEIDEKDRHILEVLRQNSHLAIGKIARKTGIPGATVHNRVKRLRAEGIIKRYTIEIDKGKLGKALAAYVMVKAMRKADQSKLLHHIAKSEAVESGSMITGEFDLIFRVRVRDMDELNGFVVKYLRTIEEVAETRTYVSYENVEK